MSKAGPLGWRDGSGGRGRDHKGKYTTFWKCLLTSPSLIQTFARVITLTPFQRCSRNTGLPPTHLGGDVDGDGVIVGLHHGGAPHRHLHRALPSEHDGNVNVSGLSGLQLYNQTSKLLSLDDLAAYYFTSILLIIAFSSS